MKNAAIRLVLLFLGLCLACACKPKETEPSFLTLNGRSSDFILTLSSDAQLISVEVHCDQEWTCLAEESASAWMVFSRERDEAHPDNWHFRVQVQALEEGVEARQAVFTFVSGSLRRQLIIRQSPPDPMRDVTVPGAYFVPGGDIIFDPLRDQWSCLHYGNLLSFRILNPFDGRVVTVSGLPANLQEGSVATVYYRVMEKGITRASGHFINMGVIRKSAPLIWLRADPGIYFILKIPGE